MKKYENEVAVISAEVIQKALDDTERQYFQGNLQKEQLIPYVHSEKCEIGMSYYQEYAHDDAHYHDEITETNYIISGSVCMRLVDTGEDFVISAGGLFSVPPKVTHILKIQPGTKIFFVKDKSVDDKHVVPFETLGLEAWFADKNF